MCDVQVIYLCCAEVHRIYGVLYFNIFKCCLISYIYVDEVFRYRLRLLGDYQLNSKLDNGKYNYLIYISAIYGMMDKVNISKKSSPRVYNINCIYIHAPEEGPQIHTALQNTQYSIVTTHRYIIMDIIMQSLLLIVYIYLLLDFLAMSSRAIYVLSTN